MKYMLLMYWDESVMSKFTPEELQKIAPEVWFTLEKDMKAAGVLVSNNGLSSIANTTTVRVRDDETFITDGPFVETHETLGGFYLIDVPNLDEALQWAAKIPSVRYGSIEVRPLWSPQA
jgi:hypothetical protein